MKIFVLIMLALLLLMGAPGCVSSDKYNAAVNELDAAKARVATLESKVIESKAVLADSETKIAGVQPKMVSLQTALTSAQAKFVKTENAARYVVFANWWLNAG